jgi:hypothetical protein
MLGINPEKVCFIILKAREFHAKEQAVIPDPASSPRDDGALQVLADHPDDPAYQELTYLIEGMDEEEQVNLVALMWLGRGDYSADEWEGALADASDRLSDHTAEYIIRTPLVADYLEEGLSALGYSCQD